MAKLYPTLCDPVDCSPSGSSVHGISQARILESGLPFLSPGDLPDPGIEPESPPLQVGSLLLSRQGSPRKLATLPHLFGGERGGCGLGQDLWVLSPASPLPGVKDATQGREEGFS